MITPPEFVVKRAHFVDEYFKLQKGQVFWVSNPDKANKYSSKYAAKKHIALYQICDTRVIIKYQSKNG